MSCGHCEAAVVAELRAVRGVQSVERRPRPKLVTRHGQNLDDATLVAAIDEAGYDVAA